MVPLFEAYSYLMLLCSFIILSETSIYHYIHCVDEEGSFPDRYQHSYASCSLPDYVITSCGARARDTFHDTILGAYIRENQCISQSSCSWWNDCDSGGGIIVSARCCNLTDFSNSSIQTYQSQESGEENDDATSIACSSQYEEIIGCTGKHDGDGGWWSSDAEYDGIYVGDKADQGNTNGTFVTGNICTAHAGESSHGVWSFATCYDTSTLPTDYSMECVMVWGSNGWTSNASCPADGTNWFMTSCSGYSEWANMDEYRIQNNVCIVTYGGDNSDEFATASAIWLS